MSELKQETINDKLKRISTLIDIINPDEPQAYNKMQKVALELVDLLELNFKIMAMARKMLDI